MLFHPKKNWLSIWVNDGQKVASVLIVQVIIVYKNKISFPRGFSYKVPKLITQTLFDKPKVVELQIKTK